MQAVYFGLELNKRAPELIGCLCTEPDIKWINLLDVCAAMAAGETVTIRPASDAEMKRAEGAVALYEIGQQLGAKIGELLDGKPKEALAAMTAIRDAAETTLSAEIAPLNWLDSKAESGK
jgi:hypothetical protein